MRPGRRRCPWAGPAFRHAPFLRLVPPGRAGRSPATGPTSDQRARLRLGLGWARSTALRGLRGRPAAGRRGRPAAGGAHRLRPPRPLLRSPRTASRQRPPRDRPARLEVRRHHAGTSGAGRGAASPGAHRRAGRRRPRAELPALVLAALFVMAGLYHLQLFRRRRSSRVPVVRAARRRRRGFYTILRTQWKYASARLLVMKKVEHAMLYFFAPASWCSCGHCCRGRSPEALRVYQAGNLAAARLDRLARPLLEPAQVVPVGVGAVVLAAVLSVGVVREAWRGHPEAPHDRARA